MKSFILIFTLCLSISSVGQQKIDITIIGTNHYFDEKYQSLQDFEAVQDFIVNLDPDIICIESIPIDDSLSLAEILPNSMKRADRLRDTLEFHQAFPYDSISINPEDPFWLEYASKDDLLRGANYYANYDIWNAYYQWFRVQQSGDSLYYFSNFQRNLSNSEYGLMVFPAAQKLAVQKLHPIDFRASEKEFLRKNSKVFKKLFFSLKWKPIKTYLKTRKEYKRAEKDGRLMEYINGDNFQNSFSNLIETITEKLPNSPDAKFVQSYWLKRNEIMANRIIEVAKSENAQTVLLTVGSAHVSHIKYFLIQSGHQVTTYGEILNQQNH